MKNFFAVFLILFASTAPASAETSASNILGKNEESIIISGCYGYKTMKNPTRIFCMQENGIFYSQERGYTEGFGQCGAYKWLAQDRILFSWPNSSEGALIHLEDVDKPASVNCKVGVQSSKIINLSDCSLAGDWKALPSSVIDPNIQGECGHSKQK